LRLFTGRSIKITVRVVGLLTTVNVLKKFICEKWAHLEFQLCKEHMWNHYVFWYGLYLYNLVNYLKWNSALLFTATNFSMTRSYKLSVFFKSATKVFSTDNRGMTQSHLTLILLRAEKFCLTEVDVAGMVKTKLASL
jgi:hypothetical protein